MQVNLKESGMSTSINKFDALERLIFEEGLRIQTIDIHKDLDLMLVVLNTKAILHQKISAHPKLRDASAEHLLQYELTAGGSGIHWPLLDEDLSLKGFLQDELRALVKKGNIAA
ncbi:MAG TPA: DUF2442 domain-containing protein [Flavisolibacter sp.]|jgi:hypothetical protein